MMKMFFSLLLILYLIGSFIVAVMLATHKLRAIDKNTHEEIPIGFFLEIAFIIYWPIILWLLIKNFLRNKE